MLATMIAGVAVTAVAFEDTDCNQIPQANVVAGVAGLANCGSTKVVQCFGIKPTPEQCEAACLLASNGTGSTCHSWAFYYPDTPERQYRGACYGRLDQVWDPKTGIDPSHNHVVSAKSCLFPPMPGPRPPPGPAPPSPPASTEVMRRAFTAFGSGLSFAIPTFLGDIMRMEREQR